MKNNQFFLSILTTFIITQLQAEPGSSLNANLSSTKEKAVLNQENEAVPAEIYTLDQVAHELKKELTTNSSILHKIHDKTFLKRFYRQNSYMPLWITEKGFDEKTQTLFRMIENDITITPKSKLHESYLFLVKYVKNKDRDKDMLTIELALSQLYLDLLQHTLYGNIDWEDFSRKLKSETKKRISGNWVPVKASYSLSELMLKPDINATLQEITPRYFGYQGLIKVLKKLKEFEAKGGWSPLPEFKRLALGDQGDNVIKLRERLQQSEDLEVCEQTSEKLFESEKVNEGRITFQPEAIFDDCLDGAVRKFQRRHGLEEDGIVGKGTQRIMNESVAFKIQKVLLNIDRIKWLPRTLENRYLVVNIPEYMLHYIDEEQTKDRIRIIVGDTKHRTPIFNERISFIVLNPYWKVPDGIVRREIIPAMMRNPGYLRKEGLEIHTTWSESSPKIDPSWLFWEDYYHGYEKFPYRIMQPPGPKNALGKIKFKFPNHFDVYLHDTPTKHLFQRTPRAFSHGCIRISEPYGLFKTIAAFNKNIDLAKSDQILKGKSQRQINIQNKLPIHIVYLTAGYNAKTGEIEFRNDIYRYDALQNIDKY